MNSPAGTSGKPNRPLLSVVTALDDVGLEAWSRTTRTPSHAAPFPSITEPWILAGEDGSGTCCGDETFGEGASGRAVSAISVDEGSRTCCEHAWAESPKSARNRKYAAGFQESRRRPFDSQSQFAPFPIKLPQFPNSRDIPVFNLHREWPQRAAKRLDGCFGEKTRRAADTTPIRSFRSPAPVVQQIDRALSDYLIHSMVKGVK